MPRQLLLSAQTVRLASSLTPPDRQNVWRAQRASIKTAVGLSGASIAWSDAIKGKQVPSRKAQLHARLALPDISKPQLGR